MCLALWAAPVAVSLLARPPWPVDETRVLALAWEMWRGGAALVPQLAGEPYPDKSPLLAWLIVGGWQLFGPSAFWARLLPALAALGGALLLPALARRLWPGRPGLGADARLILTGTAYWVLWSTLLLYDALLALGVVLSLLAALQLLERPGARGVLLLGLASGFGLLVKGPVLYVHVLPALCTLRWWRRQRAAPPGSGARLAAGLALGLGLALLWALPAGAAGGPAYRDEIVFGQLLRRAAGAGDHARPWWYYAPWLAALALPWALWPALWRALARLRLDDGSRFVLAWGLGSLLLLSLSGAKQEHYLLPALPAGALLAARALDGRAAPRRLATIAALPGAALIVVLLALVPRYQPQRDVARAAAAIADWQAQGRAVAFYGRYEGQFEFAGRLQRPPDVLDAQTLGAWLAAHPDGLVVSRRAPLPDSPPPAASFDAGYAAWPAALLSRP